MNSDVYNDIFYERVGQNTYQEGYGALKTEQAFHKSFQMLPLYYLLYRVFFVLLYVTAIHTHLHETMFIFILYYIDSSLYRYM